MAPQEHVETVICLRLCPKDLTSGEGVVLEGAGESEVVRLEVEKFQA